MPVLTATTGDRLPKYFWIADRASHYLKSIARDIEDNFHHFPAVYRTLAIGGSTFTRTCAGGLDKYFVSGDPAELHKDLISAAMDFLQRWENWIDGLQPGDLTHSASKTFHQMLLRFTKGAVKSWRIWKIDLQK